MARINITLREPILPDWIEELYREIPEEVRSRIVKTILYMAVQPAKPGTKMGRTAVRWLYSELISGNANRWGGSSVEHLCGDIWINLMYWAYVRSKSVGECLKFKDGEPTETSPDSTSQPAPESAVVPVSASPGTPVDSPGSDRTKV